MNIAKIEHLKVRGVATDLILENDIIPKKLQPVEASYQRTAKVKWMYRAD